jgi:hypothetical protein
MKENIIFWQWLTLSLFALYAGFCFCDGFRLHIIRKLSWFASFLILAVFSLRIKNEFDLTFILPISILLAIFLCYSEKKNR